MALYRAFKKAYSECTQCIYENEIFMNNAVAELMIQFAKKMQITGNYIYYYILTNDVRMTNIKFMEMYKANYDIEGKQKIIASLKDGLNVVKFAIRNEIDKV